jgi:hypothetical protein
MNKSKGTEVVVNGEEKRWPKSKLWEDSLFYVEFGLK